MRVVETQPTFVRFESETTFLNVFHGRGSFELDVEIGRLGSAQEQERPFSLGEVISAHPGGAEVAHRRLQASSPRAVASCVERLSELTKQFARAAIDGEEDAFRRLATRRRRDSVALTESYRAGDLRSDADAAWRQRDFGRVVNAYEALENLESLDLSRSEIARLRYAKPRAERLSNDALARILPEFRTNGASSYERVQKAEEQLAVDLPSDYKAMLRQANGGEGPVGHESYLILWPVEEIVEHNRGYKPDPLYAPGLTFIGTDGGNEVFAIRAGDGHFVAAPLIGMNPDAVTDRGRTLGEFLRSFP